MNEAVQLRRMARAWRALSERDREIFGAVRFDGLDYLQTAKRCGCTVGEVEQTIARVLVALDRGVSG